MAKVIKNGLIFLTVLALLGFFFYKMIDKTWVYDLPNNYKVRKLSTANVVVGVEINRDFYTTYKNKKVGVNEYVAQFQYNDQFIGIKALTTIKEETGIIFYLIDTIDQEVHGPYYDEESYLAAMGVWSKETMGDWITTTETPDGAYFK